MQAYKRLQPITIVCVGKLYIVGDHHLVSGSLGSRVIKSMTIISFNSGSLGSTCRVLHTHICFGDCSFSASGPQWNTLPAEELWTLHTAADNLFFRDHSATWVLIFALLNTFIYLFNHWTMPSAHSIHQYTSKLTYFVWSSKFTEHFCENISNIHHTLSRDNNLLSFHRRGRHSHSNLTNNIKKYIQVPIMICECKLRNSNVLYLAVQDCINILEVPWLLFFFIIPVSGVTRSFEVPTVICYMHWFKQHGAFW